MMIFFPSRINIPFRRDMRRKVFLFIRNPHSSAADPAMTGCRAQPGSITSFFGSRFQRNRRQRKKPAPLNSPTPANIPPAPARGPLRSASSLAARGERYAFSLTTLGEGSRNRCDSGKDRPGRRPGRPQVRCGTICPRSAHAGPRRQILPSGSLPSGSRPDRLTQPRCSERFGSFELWSGG